MVSKLTLTEVERQERNGRFVENNVYCCQSVLVDGMLKQGAFSFEDIENLYKRECPACEGEIEYNQEKGNYACRNCREEYSSAEDCERIQEIYEWWVVSNYMLRKLKELGEPVLSNDYGNWWGRTGTGQAIKLDCTIDKILER